MLKVWDIEYTYQGERFFCNAVATTHYAAMAKFFFKHQQEGVNLISVSLRIN